MSALDTTISPPYIWLAEELDPHFQRIAMALEFGRLLLQPHGRKYTDEHFIRQGDSVIPTDFAIEFAAPLFFLEPITTGSKRSDEDLAALFKVPIWVIRIQLQKLLTV